MGKLVSRGWSVVQGKVSHQNQGKGLGGEGCCLVANEKVGQLLVSWGRGGC